MLQKFTQVIDISLGRDNTPNTEFENSALQMKSPNDVVSEYIMQLREQSTKEYWDAKKLERKASGGIWSLRKDELNAFHTRMGSRQALEDIATGLWVYYSTDGDDAMSKVEDTLYQNHKGSRQFIDHGNKPNLTIMQIVGTLAQIRIFDPSMPTINKGLNLKGVWNMMKYNSSNFDKSEIVKKIGMAVGSLINEETFLSGMDTLRQLTSSGYINMSQVQALLRLAGREKEVEEFFSQK
jgi:hypothetical protein